MVKHSLFELVLRQNLDFFKISFTILFVFMLACIGIHATRLEVRTFGGYSFLLLPCGVLVPPLFTEPAILDSPEPSDGVFCVT